MNNIITQSKKDEIDALCKKYDIRNYHINPDGSIDVDSTVLLSECELSTLPLRFSKVSGNFECGYNQLTSLVGCPTSVGGNFNCSENRLTSLKGCPTQVGGDFGCVRNNLTSLEFCPINVGGPFYCYSNRLVTLLYFPKKMSSDIISFYDSFVDDDYDNNEGLMDFHQLITENFGRGTPIDDWTLRLPEETLTLIKYMNDYEVWTPELNLDNMNDLLDDIKDGLK